MTQTTERYLVFMETSGNQAYIYSTNKLRENIGASELTYCAGTLWPLEAAGFANPPTGQPAQYREWLKNSARLPDGSVEIVLSTSGKSMLVVTGREKAESIVAQVTSRAAREAPGLSVAGAIVPLEGNDPASVAKAITAAHHRFNRNRDLMPVPPQRFGMLPFCEPCATSGLPAESISGGDALSSPSYAKREYATKWFERIRAVFRSRPECEFFITNGVDQLQKEFEGLSWAGVAFSDGNGLGQIMMKFGDWLDPGDDYLATLRRFSLELDEATESAFYEACGHLYELGAAVEMKRRGKRLPVVPLLLGGDDLTVLVDGRYALPFAATFLRAFEATSARQPTLARIAGKALGAPRLSACAGVAIVKPHFPYHSAQALAEGLLRSAKGVKKQVEQAKKPEPFPCSALDFHVLYDAAFSGLDSLRLRRFGPDGEKLWGGPYVTTVESLEGATAEGRVWAASHHLDGLLGRVAALQASDPENGRLELPATQTHMLREAIAQGRAVADARLRELSGLRQRGLQTLIEEGESLFVDRGEGPATRFLDALTSTEFWPAEWANPKEKRDA